MRTERLGVTTRERCEDYCARLKPGQFFTHRTAAMLHEQPLPDAVESDVAVHVGAVRPDDAPHAVGVVGHRLTAQPPVVDLGGLPVVAPDEALCQLAAELPLEDLVVIADHLLNTTRLEEEIARGLLVERAVAIRRQGGARLGRAIALSRRGSGSPAETRVRLVLDAAGAPRAELNVALLDVAGRYLGKPDFVWRTERTVLEYEGDGHREREQFRYDVSRYEAMADAGWRVLRETGDDLTAMGRARLAARVLAALR